MSTRQLLWLGIAILLLAGVYLLMKSTSVPVAEEVTLSGLDTANVVAITINQPDDTTRLERTSEGWQLTKPLDWPANYRFVEQALKRVADMRIESEVSSNPERFGEYGVDSTGLSITLETKKKSVDLVLGGTHFASSNSYARLANGESVYLVRGNAKPIFKRNSENWRNKKIVKTPEESMIRFTTEEYSLRRGAESNWELATPREGEAVDETGMKRWFGSVVRLSAVSFAKAEQTAGLNWNKPDNWFEFETDNGTVTHLRFIKDPNGERYFALKNDEPTVYVVSKSIYDQIFVSLRNAVLATQEEKTSE